MFRAWREGGQDIDDLKEKLDETYRTQTTLLQQVRRSVADVATSRKRVELQLAALNQQISQLDDQARQAVGQGNDDEARAILARKVSLEKAATELSQRHADLKAEEDKLHDSAMKMEQDVESFRARKDTLAARHTAASAQAGMNDASKGITSAASDVSQAMEAAERRTRELEASADAVDELVREGLISKPGESANEAAARRFDAALDSPEVSRQMDALTDGNESK
ncbi:PspA/IM30 family protein [Aeromicrobium panaciterrae]